MAQAHTGLLLKITGVKDYDAILTILTAENGKQEIYAKSVNKPKSKRRSSLEIVNYISFTFSSSKSGNMLPFLGEIKTISELNSLKNEKHQYAEAFLLAELLNKLTIAEENYETTLSDFQQINNHYPTTKSLILFNYLLIRLLDQLGYLPELNVSVVTGESLDSDESIVSVPGELGYAAAKTRDNIDDQLVRLIKVQRFWVLAQTTAEHAIKTKLSIEDLLRLTHLQLDWAEIVIEGNLKSRFLLNTALNNII